jgi:ATP-dependent DNA helicase RecQ
MQKEQLLKQHFGYSSFLQGQEALIDRILSGQDVLGIMPTGAGKSLCFQIPALMFSGITLVVSPLISLMKDQVLAMVEAGIPAAYINSSLTPAQMSKALANAKSGKCKLIYVTPERLHTPDFLAFAQRADISLVAVDEAHCVSQWGQNFRPGYLEISAFIDLLSARPVTAAFTATATSKVKEDILSLLSLKNPFILVTGFNRPNLYFEVRRPKDKFAETIAYLKANRNKNGIIYCATRKAVEEVCERLCAQGFSATRYHAGLEDAERAANQEDFLYDRKAVMVATNAFGMGIDKSDVSFVLHYNMPKDIESYYQEAGRAGRDGSPADCILLYSGQDVVTNQFLIDKSHGNSELDAKTLEQVKEKDRERLKQMTFYCSISDCLREYILRYFGDSTENYCGNCGNCRTNFEDIDITVIAQKLMSCVYHADQRYGAGTIIDAVRGSRSEKILRLGLDQISTYGMLKDEDAHFLRDVIRHLELQGYLEQTGAEYPVLRLTPKSRAVLLGNERLTMKHAKEPPRKPEKRKSGTFLSMAAPDEYLLHELKQLRRKLAQEAGVPAYVVFSDATLLDMCRRKPHSAAEFLGVSGVGQVKLERYGKAFLDVLRAHPG